MSEQPEKTPLIDLLREVPKDHKTEWEIQWGEDGWPTGHSMCPIGYLTHKAVDLLEAQAVEIDELQGLSAQDKHIVISLKEVNKAQAAQIERLNQMLANVRLIAEFHPKDRAILKAMGDTDEQ
jgi:hypothetical protein